MLNECSRYENLGTPKIFFELFGKLVNQKQAWTTIDVQQYFFNRIVDGYTGFDGCLPLAAAVGAVTITDEGKVVLNPNLIPALVNENYLSSKLLAAILAASKKDDSFHEIFCSENVSYDIVYKTIQIDGDAFQFRYASFRQLLVNFAFIQPHPDNNIRKFVINPRFKGLFDRELLPLIKSKKMGIQQLEKMLAQKQLHGREAEEFVLKFEKRRLASHPKLESVEIISDYDVGAGFDIISFNGIDSCEIDRFVEVKSFSDFPSFHWSRNEIDVSRIKRVQYFLYLVNRAKMNEEDYEPEMIQNPHQQIIENGTKWEKRIEGYFVTQVTS
jgi:hypothetical protein